MKLKNIIYGMMCVAALGSCSDKMEYHEYNNYDEDFVKLNFGNVGGLITNIYLSMDVDFGNYSGAVLGSATDESEYAYSGNQIEDFYNGSWSPSNAKSSMWTSCYEGIANCNLYLEKFTGLTFPELALNSDYAQQMFRYANYEYEVRFLRAYFYFNLVRQYGDVPFSDHILTAEESNTLSRRPAQEIFDYIIAECDDIKDKIIVDYSKLGDMALPSSPAETGRANRKTVLALKARAALYAASPLFNPTDNRELWYRAAKANKEILDDSNGFAEKAKLLVEDYSSLWSKDNYNDATTPIRLASIAVTVLVNKYRLEKEAPIDILEIDNTAVRLEQIENLKRLKDGRNQAEVDKALAAITECVKTGKGNLLELAVEAARVRATLGEISYACEQIVGRYKAIIRTISGVYSSESKNDSDFKRACELAEKFAKKEGRQPRIMVAKMGQDGHDRGAKVVATGYADCGFDVDMGPLFQTPAEAAREAVENDVHVVGVSSLAAGHKTLVPQIIEELKKLGREDIVVIAGGVIPAQDYDFLYKAGVAAIFGPGTPVAKAACQILEILMDEE